MTKKEMVWESHKDFQYFISLVDDKRCKITIEQVENSYTKKQRGSLHVWCEMCAKVLNEHNLECEIINPITKAKYSMPWSMNLFKENVYKYILMALTGKKSTENQSSVDPSEIVMIITRKYAENGVTLPSWPSNR